MLGVFPTCGIVTERIWRQRHSKCNQFLLKVVQFGLQIDVFYFELVGVAATKGLPSYPVCSFARFGGGATTCATTWICITADLPKLSWMISMLSKFRMMKYRYAERSFRE